MASARRVRWKRSSLPFGLRMQWPAVTEADTESNEPDAKLSNTLSTATPGCAVVGVDTVRQAVALECPAQDGLDQQARLPGQCLQGQVESRVVVDDRQRAAATVAKRHITLEVHLPQGVGPVVLKAVPWRRCRAGRCIDQAMAMQDRRDGTWRNLHRVIASKDVRDLSTTPSRMRCAQCHDSGLELCRGSRW